MRTAFRTVAGLILSLPLALIAAPTPPAQAATTVPSSFVIRGSGAGHGVGMSQYGAYQLARTGSTAAQILGYYYPGISVGTANNKPRTVKVQVLGPPVDRRTKTTATFAGAKFTVSDGTGKHLGTFKAGKATLKVKGSRVNVKIGKKSLTAARLVFGTSGVATVAGAQGSYHYGNLQATVIGKRLNVVNQVAMNTEYLYGLDEMPASWAKAGGAAALRAQVIAARTYVIGQILNHLPLAQQAEAAGMPGCDCHVYDDERSQNYIGWKKAGKSANQPWVDAVNATIRPDATKPSGSAVDVLWAAPGAIAEAPYFASSGKNGGTGSNADVFGTTPLSYLVHVDDPYSAQAPGNPYLSWQRTLTQSRAAKLFGLKKITSIAIAQTYPGGLVKTLTATASSGQTKTLTKTATAWMSQLGVPAPWLASIKST
ncbi:MAG: SpoIID/LytB domain-containing protein [Vicinamibacterales bacterium]